ncbi:MAG: dihydrolipoyl dehydrogenase [Candidatus Omnitrophica bacterium]|nr:dihydrolipoyl dehydrogenase [Candidatus Omnitrophota bacterium]
MSKYDITIIGAGPGGYVAALYAAGLGKRVLVIEKDKPGGVCLNCGCIPTKTLIRSVKTLKSVKHSKEFGVDVSSHSLNYPAVRRRKDEVVKTLTKGVESLLKVKKVDVKKGFGRLVDKGVVEAAGERFESKDIIIATGTRPQELPAFKFDKTGILSSADMLDLKELPKRLLIVGGGVNGCEYAYIYASFGVEVTIVEMLDRLLPTMDRELGKNMEMILKRLNVKIMTKTRLEEIPPEYDKTVICVGRRYNTEDIGLEKVGVKTEKGRIAVDGSLRTNVPGIYAIGDVIGGYLLAHVASHEGIIACENIAGRPGVMDYGSVPLCVYTDPEISSVGLTEGEAKDRGCEVKVAKFPFKNLGKSHTMGEKDGFIKIIGNKKTDEILGVQMVGPQAADLITEAAVTVKNRMKVEGVCSLMHAHPTLSEAFMEAAYLFEGRPIHAI